ncbi:MAG TPA: DnaJ domain-containing protein [Myxococcaceae bacterium]|nr:DnaJ domain-containing protein [Myxococcaceae bacterium]
MGPAPPPTGNLAEFSPLRLYYLVASGEHTARLSFQLPDRAIEMRFRKGNPEHVSSSHPEDSIPEFLKAHKLLDDTQLERARGALGDFGNDLVSALFGLGLLTPATAFSNLAEQALAVMLKAILAQAGTFTFQDSKLPTVKVMPLGNRWAVLTALLRRIPLAEIKLRLAGDADRPVTKVEGRVAIKELPLTPQEARVINYLNGTASLNELARKFPQDSENLHRLVLLLRDLELVAVAGARAAASGVAAPSDAAAEKPRAGSATREAPARRAASGPPILTPSRGVASVGAPPRIDGARQAPPRLTSSRGAGLPAAKPDSAQPPASPPPRLTPSKGAPQPAQSEPAPPSDGELESLRSLAKRLKDDNYFQVLGIDLKANAAAVKVAYIKLAKLYHPDTISATASPEVAKLKEEIFAAIGQAYRVLLDDKSRANYAEIIEGGETEQEMLPLSQVLLAEEKFERGQNLVRAKRFPEALTVFDEAISGSQEVAEFYAWRGYAKFFALADKKKAQAEANRDLQTALQKSQYCSSAHYFLGQIAKLTGDTKTALTHFKKAVELKPDYIDAKREIRLLTKK